MTTAQDVIKDALEKLGVYAANETMTGADAARGLNVLNDMLDSWSNESLTCLSVTEQHVKFTPGIFSYTIGPTGAVVGPRPLSLVTGPGCAYILDTNGNQFQIDVIPRSSWNLRGTRNTNSNFPDVLFYDPTFPNGTLNFDPIPNIAYTAYFDSYLQLSDYATLTTAFSLPPGYKLAIATNLALLLKPYFASAQVDPLLVQQAAESKANVKRTNIREITMRVDPEITAKGGRGYNIYSDSVSGRGR